MGEGKRNASAVYSKPAPRSTPIPSSRQPWGNRHGNSHLGALVNMKVGKERRRRGCCLNGTAAGSVCLNRLKGRDRRQTGKDWSVHPPPKCSCGSHSQRKSAPRTRRAGSLRDWECFCIHHCKTRAVQVKA